jgi:hypothetical protein
MCDPSHRTSTSAATIPRASLQPYHRVLVPVSRVPHRSRQPLLPQCWHRPNARRMSGSPAGEQVVAAGHSGEDKEQQGSVHRALLRRNQSSSSTGRTGGAAGVIYSQPLGDIQPAVMPGDAEPLVPGPPTSTSAPNVQICASHVLIGIEPMSAHNGGYRTSSATQCKLRRVTGEFESHWGTSDRAGLGPRRYGHRHLVVVVAPQDGQPELPARAHLIYGLCQHGFATGLSAVHRDDEVAAGEPG